MSGRGLAAAGFADQRQRLAPAQLERHAVDGAHMVDHPHQQALFHREPGLEVADLQQGGAIGQFGRPGFAGGFQLGGIEIGFAEQMAEHLVRVALAAVAVAFVGAAFLRESRPRRLAGFAAVEEAAAFPIGGGIGHHAGDGAEFPAAVVGGWDRFQQAPGVRMLRLGEDFIARTVFGNLAGVHHADVVGDLVDNAEIVGDDHDRHVGPFLQLLHQRQDLGLDGDIEGRGRLVGNQQVGFAGEGHRDHHPLFHAAGKLMGKTVDPGFRRRDADHPEQVECLGAGLPAGHAAVLDQGFGELVADPVERIERGHRLLEDHGDLVAADLLHLRFAFLQQILAIEENPRFRRMEGIGGEQPHQREGRLRFAAAGFANHRQRLPLLDMEADAVDSPRDAVLADAEMGL